MEISTNYRGQGILNDGLILSDAINDKLFYLGDKPPHMIWEKFKLKLNNTYLVATRNGVQHNDNRNLYVSHKKDQG